MKLNTLNNLYRLALVLVLTGTVVVGCAILQPGSDPLVVRTEQTLTLANGTFDFVLHTENVNRSFWKTNAPAFANFCDWLRTPIPYGGSNVARCVEMQLNVDDLKLAYKAAKTAGNSNALFSAWGTLNAAVSQAGSWSNIVVTPIHP